MSPAQSSLAQFWVGLAGLIFFYCLPTAPGRERSGPEPLLICVRDFKGGYFKSHTRPCFALVSLTAPWWLDETFFLLMGGKGPTELHPDFMRTHSNRSRCGDVLTNLACGEGSTCLGREFHNAQCQLSRLHMAGRTSL